MWRRFPAGVVGGIAGPVKITQTDIRELQLAEGAIAAGVRIALREAGVKHEDVKAVYRAGAFSNDVNSTSARRIGLIDFPTEIVIPSGNTALRGAKRALCDEVGMAEAMAKRVGYVALNEQGDFQEMYVGEMGF